MRQGVRYLPLLLLLVACATTQPAALPAPSEDTCKAITHSALIGQDATALEKTLILGMVRVIRPGDAVTMDFRPSRINFTIDENEVISRIFCG